MELERSKARIQIELLGGPRVWVDGVLAGDLQEKPGAILALLALSPRHSAHREELIDCLWSDTGISDPAASLRTHLSKLRAIFGRDSRVISTGLPVVTLCCDGLWIDVSEFDALHRLCLESDDADRKIDILFRMAQLYRGPLTPGLYVDEILRYRSNYEAKIAEVRRSLKELSEAKAAGRDLMTTPIRSIADRSDRQAYSQPLTANRSHRIVDIRWGVVAAVCLSLGLGLSWAWSSLRHSPPRQSQSADERLRSFRALCVPAAGETPDGRNERLSRQGDLLVALGDEAQNAWYGKEEPRWLQRISQIDKEMRSPIAWLAKHKPDKALEVLGSLSHYWSSHDVRDEPLTWLNTSLKRARHPQPAVLARALLFHSRCLLISAGIDSSRSRQTNRAALEEAEQARVSFANCGDAQGEAHGIRLEGHIQHALREEGLAQNSFDEAIRLFHSRQDKGGEAAAWAGRALFLAYDERRPECYLRLTRDALRSETLYASIACADGRQDVWTVLIPYVSHLLNDPPLASNLQAQSLLTRFAAVASSRLSEPEAISHPNDMLTIRKSLARVALRIGQRQTAVEQLGHLLSQHGDPHLGQRGDAGELAQVYLDNVQDGPDLPLSIDNARLIINDPTQRAHSGHLSLETAVAIASR